MSERHTIKAAEVADQARADFAPKRPHFSSLEQAEERIPRLHTPGAWPISRDRWEQVVTNIIVNAAPEEIWAALMDPGALKLWFAACHGSLEKLDSDCVLDFEDGEFFLCRPVLVESPGNNGGGDYKLQYLWRWLGIGQPYSVTWQLEGVEGGTQVTVTEEAVNPPSDWRTWHGGGWPGILEQLSDYLRTGIEWRWPWRRTGPYVQIELPVSIYEAWDRLLSPSGIKFWLQTMYGSIEPEQSLTVLMGDASGMVEMKVHEIVQPGQSPPSFLPHMSFSLKRHAWNSEVGGRLWIEPAGWGSSIFQVFHYNWEGLPPGLQLSERKILTSFWAGAMQRASQLCGPPALPTGPHSWT